MRFWQRRGVRRWVVLGIIAAPIVAAALVGYYRWWAGQVNQALSRTVAGRRVLVDPGHGGIDPGVIRGDLLEKDINLAISLELKKLLQEAGMTVLLTRETDIDLCYSKEEEETGRRKKLDLRSRVALTETFGAEIYLGIHTNASTIAGCKGPQTFYRSASNPDGGRLAALIQEELSKVSPTVRQAADVNNQFMLKTLKIPAVTVEVGFLSNGQDAAKLVRPAVQRRLAWAIFTGTVRFFAEVPEEQPAPGNGR